MSARTNLLDLLCADLERELGRKGAKLLNTVKLYGGEFVAAEIAKDSVAAPACLLSCLGWGKARNSRVAHARTVKLVFFIVTKDTNRTARMMQAVGIAERLSGWLQDWRCTEPVLNGCVGTFDADSIVAENLYGRTADSAGLGLWVVRANIDVSYCALREPLVHHGGDVSAYMQTLLVPTIEIESAPQTHIDAAAVTEPAATLNQTIHLPINQGA